MITLIVLSCTLAAYALHRVIARPVAQLLGIIH